LILLISSIGVLWWLLKDTGSVTTAANFSNSPNMKYKDWRDLKRFAEGEGFTVTSTTGGQHNVGSKHGRGLAVDVRTRDKSTAQCNALIAKAKAEGITVRDERTKPAGQKVWSGPHIHLEL
jgi:hypothetical protein